MADPWSETIPGGVSATGMGVSSIGAAATGAVSKGGAGGAMDQMMQKIMAEVFSKPDISGMIQNKPQVMLPQPIRPKQMEMGQPIGNVDRPQTAGGRQRNDINNLISSVGNVVKAGINQQREKQDRDLMSDLAVITAASSQPDDPHNKAILDSIASDPKRVKRLQKALGYNPLAGEPPPPEAQTLSKFAQQNQQKQVGKFEQVKQAIAQHLGPQAAQITQPFNPNDPSNAAPSTQEYLKNRDDRSGVTPQQVQAGGQSIPGIPQGSAMQNLLSRMPNTPQISPLVQLQAGLIKAGVLPKADTSLKAMTDMFKDIMTNDAKYAEIQGRLAEKDKELAGKLQEIRERGKFLIEQEKMKQTGAGERATTRATATVESAKIRGEATKEAVRIRQQNTARLSEIKQQHSLLVKATTALDQDIKNLDVQIASAKGQRKEQLIAEQEAKKAQKTANESLMQLYDKQSDQLKESLRQSPTSILNEVQGAGGQSQEEEMDQEDRIF